MASVPRLGDSGNDLLNLLPAEEFDTLKPILQPITLKTKQILYRSHSEVSHIHFPTTALISLVTLLYEGEPVEASAVGREGFVGVAASLSVAASPHHVVCQMNGDCLRLPVQPFREAMARCPGLSRAVQRYIAYSLRTAYQTVACNAKHSAEARASRWLLLIHDQARGGDFPMTQKFLSHMLGMRRQTVSGVAAALQDAGLIHYRRGIITVLDRPGLERTACECYATLRDYYSYVFD
jgi:CRP-like cAMP-binding protein